MAIRFSCHLEHLYRFVTDKASVQTLHAKIAFAGIGVLFVQGSDFKRILFDDPGITEINKGDGIATACFRGHMFEDDHNSA